ncbi:cupin domain-containing protein [Ruegeria sp. 2012CJ41-6]|uniref:Cupin domain-containing protein n=1 Tax=Ruegeria spongiae TaxID=2942209 RepID=A0ABT0Q3P9_9RHOB|nr:cupin domain-containing protein [Ruegeria spongiae]MCL6284506.1 cupin domain-containing protein [Ruegeria spongiae]
MKRILIAGALALTAGQAVAKDSYPPLELLLQTDKTVVGEPLAYPPGQAEITMAIITMMPGQKTPAHRHGAPLAGYILEGEITVDYGAAGIRTYLTGDALVEAMGTDHVGTNTGDGIVRILTVFAGAQGTANTILDE